MLDDLAGLTEINRLRAILETLLWAVASERYQLAGLRAIVRQQAAMGLRLTDAQEAAVQERPALRSA